MRRHFFSCWNSVFFVLVCVWLMPTTVHGRLLALGMRGWAAWHRSRVELRNKYGYEVCGPAGARWGIFYQEVYVGPSRTELIMLMHTTGMGGGEMNNRLTAN